MLTLLAIFAYLWRRRRQPLGEGDQFGRYLILAGVGRFLVEFIRLNPIWFGGLTAFSGARSSASRSAPGSCGAPAPRRSRRWTSCRDNTAVRSRPSYDPSAVILPRAVVSG